VNLHTQTSLLSCGFNCKCKIERPQSIWSQK